MDRCSASAHWPRIVLTGDGRISFEEFQTWWLENGGELQKMRHLAFTVQLSDGDILLLVAQNEASKNRWVTGLRTMLRVGPNPKVEQQEPTER